MELFKIRLLKKLSRVEEPLPIDKRFSERNVLVGVIRNKYQLNALLFKRFYHIPMSQIIDCSMPVKYVAVYQSKRQFGKMSGIRIYGEVLTANTVPRSKIREIPKNSDEPYLYCRIKRWHRLPNAIEASDMDSVAFSTSMFLLKNAKNLSELKIRSEDEYTFYTVLYKVVKGLVRNQIPSHRDIVYRDYTVKLQGGCLYLYFADAIQCVIGYDVFLKNPMDVVKQIFDYYPELQQDLIYQNER